MTGEMLAEFSGMENVYRARWETVQKDEALCMDECFVLKYLLETCNSGVGTILQFGKGSGLEFEAIARSLRPGFRILLVNQDTKTETEYISNEKRGQTGAENNGQGLVTPLNPLDAFNYLAAEIGRVQVMFVRTYHFIEFYFKRYEQLLFQNGYVALFLDHDPEPASTLLNYLDTNKRYLMFYKTERLAVYRLVDPAETKQLMNYKHYMRHKLDVIRLRVKTGVPKVPVVGLGVLTYNHAHHITQCLEGMFSQTGNFRKKIVIVDDCSDDGTSQLVDDYLRSHAGLISDAEVVLVHNEKNLGALRSVGILLYELMKDTDFFTYIEGDDYWCSPQRTQKHLDILRENPQVAFCVNAFKFFLEDKKKMISGNRFSKLAYKYNNTYDLISNYIGNSGCYFYRSSLLQSEDFERIKRMEIEWQLILLLSMQGDCYFLDEELNVYRKHEGGTWSELKDEKKDLLKLNYLADINRELGLLFDDAFIDKSVGMMQACFLTFRSRYNLAIIDKFAGFSKNSTLRAETQFLLENTDLSMLFIDIYNLQFRTGNRALEELHNIREAYPALAEKICAIDGWGALSAKILLAFDVQTAYMTLAICERYKIPLVCVITDTESVNQVYMRRLLSSQMLHGLVLGDAVADSEMVRQKKTDGTKALMVKGKDFNTRENGEKILHFLCQLTEEIDYDALKDERLFNDSSYAEKHDLHNQFPVWNIDLGYDSNHGKFYNACKKCYLRYCPNRIKPYIKKLWKQIIERQKL